MLAEPRRRKQRISVDPQNLQWGEDGSRVGKRMMERMGWSGGGLGRHEDGMQQNIRLRANHTQKGLGSDKSTNAADNQWMGHHDEFALILEKLNQRKKRAAGAEGVEEEKEIMEGNSSSNHHAPPASVEKEPQQSKMRKNYKRYSKVRSDYTEEQKRAIFGLSAHQQQNKKPMLDDGTLDEIGGEEKEMIKKKKRKDKKKIRDGKGAEEEEDTGKEEQQEKHMDEPKTIIKAPMTMDRYFAQKMAEKVGKILSKEELVKEEKRARTDQQDVPAEVLGGDAIEVEEHKEPRKKWKKKKDNFEQ